MSLPTPSKATAVGSQRSRSYQNRRAFISSLVIVSGMCPIAVAVAGDNEVLSDKVSNAREWQLAAEDWVRKIKANKKLSPVAATGARDRYEQARAAFDAWRFALKTDLATNLSTEASSKHEQRLQQATDRAAEFMHYCERVLTRGGSPVHAVKGLAQMINGDFFALLGQLYVVWREEKKQSRDEMNKILDQLEWRTFDSI